MTNSTKNCVEWPIEWSFSITQRTCKWLRWYNMNPSQSISPSASLSVRVSPTLYIRPAFCLTILVYRLLCIALTDTIKQNVFSNSSPANVQTSNYQVIKKDVLYNSPKYGTLRILRPVYSDSTQLDVELSCVAINGPLHMADVGPTSVVCSPFCFCSYTHQTTSELGLWTSKSWPRQWLAAGAAQYDW